MHRKKIDLFTVLHPFMLFFCLVASECKPCPEFSVIPDSRCATADADRSLSSLETGDPLFMVEEKVIERFLLHIYFSFSYRCVAQYDMNNAKNEDCG